MQSLARQLRRLNKHYPTRRFKVKVYNFLRLSIFPYEWLSSLVSQAHGRTLCLGCGYGTLETLLAIDHPSLQIIASDIAADRIQAAKATIKDVPNINFSVQDAVSLGIKQEYDSILFMDLMHHLPKGEQVVLLNKLWAALKPGGTLIMKDVDTRPRWKYYWNMVHDRLMAGLPLSYYDSSYYQNYFRKKGAKVTYTRPTKFVSPYNHYAIVVKKTSE